MHIVVLVGQYYPIQGAPASCINKYFSTLLQGNEITLIYQKTDCAEAPIGNHTRNYTISNWRNDLRIFCNKKIKNKARFSYLYKVFLFILRVFGAFINIFIYPNGNKWMVEKYIERIEEINKNDCVDCIITVSNPITTQYAAYSFKLLHEEVKWLIFMTDPFTLYPALYKYKIFKSHWYNRFLRDEGSFYKKANHVFFVDSLFAKEVALFNLDEDKASNLSFVFEEHRSITHFKPESDEVLLVYAGSLRRDVRNPTFMLKTLSRVPNIIVQIYQVGDCNSILSKYPQFKCFPLLDREKYEDLIFNKADILINIGNSCSIQDPSKLFEYISTGKPIINFYQVIDKQYTLIDKYPLGLNFGEKDDIKKIIDFCAENKHKKMEYDMVASIFPEYTIGFQYSKIEKVLMS